MCGIAGLISMRSASAGRLSQAGLAMHAALAHRGPDDAQIWVEQEQGIVLAHRRLAVVDLSVEGRQPMASSSGRYHIVFNGEIYNYPEIQQQLSGLGHIFKGRSDTEVLLAAIDHWGLNQTLQKINGQFAFGLWDSKNKILHLVRDRFGKKPLYVGWVGEDLVFASELKALHALEHFSPSLNQDALALYMHYGYVCAPYSIFSGIWQLLPGSRLALNVGSLRKGDDLSARMEPYWSLTQSVDEARAHPFAGSEGGQIEVFEQMLNKAVAERMVCDVPLGVFLSGGVDSTTIAALMQQHSDRPVKSFSIGFDNPAYDESPYAAQIARHLGTDHETLAVNERDALGVIPDLADIFDEPFADPSAIPTYLISKLARRQVTVALTGDGGDELLGGYDRHIHLPPLWQKIGWMPAGLRRGLAALAGRLPASFWQTLSRDPQMERKMRRLLAVMGCPGQAEAYHHLLAAWEDLVVPGARLPAVPVRQPASFPRGLGFADYMIFGDTLSYRVDDLMVKADRASMAVALEARAPLMDYQLCAFCWRLPLSAKIRHGQGKWLLRQVLKKYVPDSLMDRPKMGFSVPVAQWLRGDLQGWANDLLSPARLRQQGLFDEALITRVWEAHKRGDSIDPNGRKIWTILMMQSWLDRWMKG